MAFDWLRLARFKLPGRLIGKSSTVMYCLLIGCCQTTYGQILRGDVHGLKSMFSMALGCFVQASRCMYVARTVVEIVMGGVDIDREIGGMSTGRRAGTAKRVTGANDRTGDPVQATVVHPTPGY